MKCARSVFRSGERRREKRIESVDSYDASVCWCSHTTTHKLRGFNRWCVRVRGYPSRVRVGLCRSPRTMTVGKMTVAQLKAALTEKGLDATGLKAVLVERLEQANAEGGGEKGAKGAAETVDEPEPAPQEEAKEDAEEKGDGDDKIASPKEKKSPKTKRKRSEDNDDDDDSKKTFKKEHDSEQKDSKPSFEINVKGNEGRVIGKGGETIRHLESTYGVKIEMKRDRGVAIVSGDDASIFETVKTAISDVIENGDTARGGSVARGGGGDRNPHRNPQMHSGMPAHGMPNLIREADPDEVLPFELQGDDLDTLVEIQVPCPGKEGRVIGKQGATIKELERQSGANMKVVKGSGVCDIKGPKRLVINARRAVLDTLALQVDRFVGVTGGGVQGDWQCPACGANVFASKDRCFACGVPKPAHGGRMGGAMGAMGGAAMGAGGYAMAPMSAGGYGAHIQAYGGYQMAGAVGQTPIGAVPSGATTSVEVLCRGSEGRVIGKGGEMIKYIQGCTGTKLDMKRDVGTVMITGPAEGVQQAQGLINEVIENGDTRDKGGLVPGAYGGQMAGSQHPSMMGGHPVMVAVPVQGGQMPQGGYAPQGYAYAPQGYYAPQPGYPAPQQQAGGQYDPNQYAAQATASAEWGQQAGVAAQAAPSTAAPQQQGEWQTHYSEGRAYYYNVATGETRWA